MAAADKHFKNGNYTDAYSLYFNLWDKKTFPDANFKILSQRLKVTRNRIDSLRIETKNYIKQSYQKQRSLELSTLNKGINEQKIIWEKETIHPILRFIISIDVNFLDFSYWGIVQLPEKILDCKNLEKIDLRGNPNLDSIQIFGFLNQLPKLKEIKIDTLKFVFKDTINYIILNDYKKQLQNLTKNVKITNTIVKRLLDSAYLFYEKGKYSISLFRYEQANAETSAYKNRIKAMQDIVANTIILIQRKLEAEKAYAEKIKRNTDIAIFDRAAKNSNSNFTTCRNFTDEDFLKIDSLNFENFKLLQLHPYIEKCQNLKHINLLGNPDIDWKDCFTKVKKTGINSVYVSVNDLSDIDSIYWHLITGIEILQNELQKIPENILQQKQLTYLDLSVDYLESRLFNNFTTLPSKLFELSNLKYVNLNFCQIESLSPEIGNLTNLSELNLGANSLNSLPPEIGNLKNLTVLNLEVNQLNSLPPEIGNLTNLTELYLGVNQLSSLPIEIGNLTNLTELDLSENQLGSLPLKIGNLTNLIELDLSENQLNSLSPEIGNFTNLTDLYLRYNNFSQEEKQKIESWFKGTGCKIYW